MQLSQGIADLHIGLHLKEKDMPKHRRCSKPQRPKQGHELLRLVAPRRKLVATQVKHWEQKYQGQFPADGRLYVEEFVAGNAVGM